jgi:hypothetical protein
MDNSSITLFTVGCPSSAQQIPEDVSRQPEDRQTDRQTDRWTHRP